MTQVIWVLQLRNGGLVRGRRLARNRGVTRILNLLELVNLPELKSKEIKTRHVQKLAINKKSTFFALSSWNFVKMITSWGDYFHKVSPG